MKLHFALSALLGYSLSAMAVSIPFESQVLFGHWASPEGCILNVKISAQSNPLDKVNATLSFNGQEYTEELSLNLGPWQDTIVALANAITGNVRTSVPYSLTLQSGDNSADFTGQVNIVSNDWHRNILVEEGTGTWCGNCPRGIVGMQLTRERYPDSFVGICMHYANAHPEPMAYSEYGRFLVDNGYITAFPEATINRIVSEIDPYNDVYNGGYYEIALTEATPAMIECTAEYRNDYKTIRFNATGILDMVEDGHEYGFSFCCIENDVHKPGDGHYSQFNNYGNNVYGEFYGFEKYPSHIPPDSMWYQEVARSFVQHDFDGISGSITNPQSGVPFTYSCDMELPATLLNPDNMSFVAMIVDATTGEVLNCCEIAEAEILHGWAAPLLYEDFSYGLFRQGFIRIDADGNNPFSSMGLSVGDAWGIGADEGNYYAYSTSYYSPSGKADDWLITPAIPVAHVFDAQGNLRLSWRARSSSSKYKDSYEVRISTGGCQIADFNDLLIFTIDGESADWTDHDIAIEDFHADSIRIAFRNVTNNGEKLLLDDIRLYTPVAASLPQTRFADDDGGTMTRFYSLDGRYLGTSLDVLKSASSQGPRFYITRQRAADGTIKTKKVIIR